MHAYEAQTNRIYYERRAVGPADADEADEDEEEADADGVCFEVCRACKLDKSRSISCVSASSSLSTSSSISSLLIFVDLRV